jgi:hypothetical protein
LVEKKRKKGLDYCPTGDCIPIIPEIIHVKSHIDIERNNFQIFKQKNQYKESDYFKEQILEQIEQIFPALNNIEKVLITNENKMVILKKAEEIIEKHKLRAKNSEIRIPKDLNIVNHAMAIIYTIVISDKCLPMITQDNLIKVANIKRRSSISDLFNRYYKDLVQEYEFNFSRARLNKSRNYISFYLFNQMIDKKSIYENVNIDIDKEEIIEELKIIVINKNPITLEGENLLTKLIEKDIKIFRDMAKHPDTFNKYFSDLFDIIRFLIISIKYHKIISADFSVLDFVRYLMNRGINLFYTSESSFHKAIKTVFNFLKNTKHSSLFPSRVQSGIEYEDDSRKVDQTRKKIVGNRIKLYVLKHIYHGKYYINGMCVCPECFKEGLTANISLPLLRSKEFHHLDEEIKGVEYSSDEFYSLFVKNRGNPFFLLDLIDKLENENVVLLCASHHNTKTSSLFNWFKKLISWVNIPKEFPQDIFDLPAEVITILIEICVDNFSKTKDRDDYKKDPIRAHIRYNLMKRYIIDWIFGGLCPTCGEFNTRDHLPAFEFNHLFKVLYKLGLITFKQKEEFKKIKRKIPSLYKSYPCNELANEMEIEEGGYVCANCHTIIHEDISVVNKIYDNPKIIQKIILLKEEIIKRYRQNLIHNTESIGNPLKREVRQSKTFLSCLFALFEITEEKKRKCEDEGVIRTEIMDYLGLNSWSDVFERRELSKRYIESVYVKSVPNKPKKYYLNYEGKKIVRLFYYFKDHFENLKLIS